MNPETIVVAQSLTDWAQGKIADVQELVIVMVALLAVVAVVSTWWTSKALVPTLTAMLLAGLVLWAVANVGWLQDRVGEEIGGTPAALASLAAWPAAQPQAALTVAPGGSR